MHNLQHLIQQLGKLPGKELTILTMNAKGELQALLQPGHTSSNTVEKVLRNHTASQNLQIVYGISSFDFLLYDDFPAFKLLDNPLFESPIFLVYPAAKIFTNESLDTNFECAGFTTNPQLSSISCPKICWPLPSV